MSQADKLRKLLAGPDILVMPGCWDAISARLIERAGFPVTFMGGFCVAAARAGLPDTGLISYAEMVDQGRNICSAVSIPVLGDGDTGYGNAINVKRTVQGYAQAGFACVMIEDQVAPKRCGHTRGKQVVGRDEAFSRIRAAVDARDELRDGGGDILVMARTDANATDGIEEAIARAKAFQQIGADISFLEAPKTEAEMRRYCEAVPGPKMANMVEQGDSPFLPPAKLAEIGYKIAVYPITLILAGIRAMEDALAKMKAGGGHPERLAEFAHLRDIVGFPDYYEAEKKYTAD
ncbi:MAG: isocitrate lyase/PEP mutase family protein [Rhodospirillales bacterium]|nr:isocitrate lyase/PEP mutase family protein [Rhodospirillales bacterium]